MAFKNALKLLLSKFGLVWILLLYILAALLVLASLSLPFAITIVGVLQKAGVGELFGALFNSIIGGEGIDVIFDRVHTIFSSLSQIVQTNTTAAFNSVMLFVVLQLVYRFIIGLYEIPLINVLEGAMSSNARIGFMNSLISRLGKSCKFVLVKMIYTVLFDICVYILISLLFDLFSVPFLKFFAPFLIMLVFLVLMGLRYTILANWSPAVVVGGKGIFRGFGYSFKTGFRFFGSIFSSFIIAWTLIVAFNVLVGLFTFGAGLLVTVPVCMLFISLLNMTTYYGKNNRRYYVDAVSVVTPPETQA